MTFPSTRELVFHLILYVILPLWGVTAFVDWCCHRVSKIEHTTGVRESIIHSIMGIQVGIPIVLGIVFRINVLVFLLCLAAWLAHEFVAHWDIATATDVRRISLWEVHAHSYLATIPFYLIALIAVLNPETVLKTLTLDWAGEMKLIALEQPIGGNNYLKVYLGLMMVICVVPYTEELIRCLVAQRKRERAR